MSTGEGEVLVAAFAPPVVAREGGKGDGSTWSAAASPRFVTSSAAVNDCPRLRAPGTTNFVIASAARDCTVAGCEDTGAAARGAPEFASAPDAPPLTVSVPVAVPFSASDHLNVADPPPGMSTGGEKSFVVAAAPPVAAICGGSGFGTTPRAVTWPRLTTVIAASNDWPRLTPAGSATDRTTSHAGSSTAAVTVETGPVDSAAAGSFASWPDTVAESASVPAAVPFSVNVQVNVALSPARSVSASIDVEVDAAGPSCAFTAGSEGTTRSAAASPVFVTESEAENVCPRLMRAGS